MSCEICRGYSCTRSFHSIEEQEAFDERQEMSDDVEVLREEVQELKAELAEWFNAAHKWDCDSPDELSDKLSSLIDSLPENY